MAKRFHTSQNQGLQNAYAAWANALPVDKIVAIALRDPEHAMCAFFACAHIGRRVCMAVDNLDNRFATLTDPLAPSDVKIDAGPPAPFITFTSGSTNHPKAILRDAKTWIYSFERNGIRTDDTVAIIGNLSHSLPHYAACEAMHIGATPQFCKARLHGTPSIVYATPTQLRLVTDSFKTVRLLMVGGGHFTATDRAHCTRLFPNAIVRVFYGTAETSFISIADETTPEGSVGQPYDGVSVRISGDEVHVKTPMMATGYLDHTTDFNPNTPFATGEIGEIDPHGNLLLQGRKDRRVTISDKSIHLDAIEAELMAQNGVTHAAVIALPNAARGLRAFACVMGANANHPMLGGTVVLDNWPTLLSGKTDYGKLREILSQAFA